MSEAAPSTPDAAASAAVESCAATDAAVCDAVVVDGNPATCIGIVTTTGTPCVHSPATDPDGVPGSGDETAESCEAADEAICTGKVLDGTAASCTTGGGTCTYTPATRDCTGGCPSQFDASSSGLNPHRFELTKSGRHGCKAGWFECGNRECIPMVDVCDGVVELSIEESCVATDPSNAQHVSDCANVDISGSDAVADEAACDAWLVCTYTAGVAVVTVQSCQATDENACAAVVMDAVACAGAADPAACVAARPNTAAECAAAGFCTYTPDDINTVQIDDTCIATHKALCEGIAFGGGDKTACENAGECTYKPADCSDGTDEGWATCAGYGAYTNSAMATLGMSGTVADYGVVSSPFVVSEVSAELKLTTDEGANTMFTLAWSPEGEGNQHTFTVSRHFSAAAGITVAASSTTSTARLGDDLGDPVRLLGSLAQSNLRVIPTNDPTDTTMVGYVLQFPDPSPPTAQQITDGITSTTLEQTFPALSDELIAEGRSLTSSLLTDVSLFSQLKEVGILTTGSINVGFGSIAAASIDTSVELIAGGALTAHETSWISAECQPPIRGDAGCFPLPSSIKLGIDHTASLAFPAVVQSQLIISPTTSADATAYLYEPPASGLVPGVVDSCAALDIDVCAAVVLDGLEATCTGSGVCSYTAQSCVATDAAVCDAVAVDGNPATCTSVVPPTGTPCVHSPAADPDGVPGSGDETAESCEAADEATCAGKVLDGTALSCTAGGGSCIHTAEECVATDLAACAAITPNGDASLCLGASSASSAVLLAAGQRVCNYSPGPTTCIGTAPSATGCVCNRVPPDCASQLVPGDAISCIAALNGACTYTPDNPATAADEEACAPTVSGACTVDVYDRPIDLASMNKIGWRSERTLTSNSKQYWLTAIFDPITPFSLGGSRELFIEDTGQPGLPASILWVGKPTEPQRISQGGLTLESPYTAGYIEGDATTLTAGSSFSLTVSNPLIKADSLVFVTNVDDTYSASVAGNKFRARPYKGTNAGLQISGATYPAAPRPTLLYYAEVSAGQFVLTVQNADDFDSVATADGYVWKVAWVALV